MPELIIDSSLQRCPNNKIAFDPKNYFRDHGGPKKSGEN